tara:strand:+ start:486 stop:893 length:408 start_codon:yes stop_codon:yes gene_type:complete
MDGVILTPLKSIHHPDGNIYHAMKKNDSGFDGFGEAYCSSVHKNSIKGWKKHTEMTLNLVVVSGAIKFVVFDDVSKIFFSIELSQKNYQRLTVKPNLWVAFQGINDNNMLLNIANLAHDASEAKTVELSSIDYEW